MAKPTWHLFQLSCCQKSLKSQKSIESNQKSQKSIESNQKSQKSIESKWLLQIRFRLWYWSLILICLHIACILFTGHLLLKFKKERKYSIFNWIFNWILWNFWINYSAFETILWSYFWNLFRFSAIILKFANWVKF